MLYFLAGLLRAHFSYFNVFQYITVRIASALLTALFVGLFCGGPFIRFLKRQQKNGQPIRSCAPQTHLAKSGTPTMGGILILGSTLTGVLLWSSLANPFVGISLFALIAFGLLGFYDDWVKLSAETSNGLSARWKLAVQAALSLLITVVIIYLTPEDLALRVPIPFFKHFSLFLGIFYFLWGFLVITGTSNAVNLTDGLDGLAIMPAIYVAGCFVLISYLVGHMHFSNYLYIPYIPQSSELAVFLGALIGGSLAFLWFNAPPAKVFMGDTGSLSIGAVLGTVALLTHHELVLAIVGGVFVLEAGSVLLQIFFFKISHGRRIFLMAPIHHHFEKKGWPEATVTIRFWIISLILALLGLSTLKFR
ncbi:phospho-N-acetylmuramoyl-pentapeptide-transferase [Alphaproteobacteria bacterium]|nr:phospho-N-acetylmuramoyl-pentapeptide-transferase [Alphaproteobacteria bacterium]GHS95844.1 phospho-N-acetylmuramoyl-pentapeptide-transferase [Alphaproteobacteria bacterium]